MKDAFVMLVAIAFASGYTYMICNSKISYYTTWALGVHVVFFIAFVINILWFGDNKALTRWGFAPGLCVAISVAVAVVYIITSQWDDLFDEFCIESDACYDLMLEFMITHYTPPFGYFLVYLTDGSGANAEFRKPELHWLYHWLLLSQASLIPGNIYASFYNMNIIYGEGTKNLGMVLYGLISTCWAFVWCIFFKD